MIQVPCDSGTRGVYRIVDIQTNETRDLPDVVHSGGIILKRNSKEDRMLSTLDLSWELFIITDKTRSTGRT